MTRLHVLTMKREEKIRANRPVSPEKVAKIQELVKDGSSLRSTAIKTNSSYSTVYRHVAQFSKRQTRIRISAFDDQEWGYIVGLLLVMVAELLGRKQDIMS